jgi:hypothetical protein
MSKTEIDWTKTGMKTNFVVPYQFVYLWQSKFQSLSLCSVDAAAPSLHTCSSLYEEGV